MSELTPENYDSQTFETIQNPVDTVETEFQTQPEEEVSTSVDQPKPDSKEDKSIAHFQRIAQEKHDLAMQKEQLLKQKDAELEALRVKQLQFEQQFKPKEEELLPPKPANQEDPMDRLRYAEELASYNQKLFEKEIGKINAEREQIKKQNEVQAFRRNFISDIMNVGASADEAPKVYDFGFSQVSTDPKHLYGYYKYVMGQTSPSVQNNKFDNVPLPAGVSAGETESQTVDPHKKFNEDNAKYALKGRWL